MTTVITFKFVGPQQKFENVVAQTSRTICLFFSARQSFSFNFYQAFKICWKRRELVQFCLLHLLRIIPFIN